MLVVDEQDSPLSPTNVLNCHTKRQLELAQLLIPYGLKIESVADDELIPGSFFGEREAGFKKTNSLSSQRHTTSLCSS